MLLTRDTCAAISTCCVLSLHLHPFFQWQQLLQAASLEKLLQATLQDCAALCGNLKSGVCLQEINRTGLASLFKAQMHTSQL
jgi:hypothetical protein